MSKTNGKAQAKQPAKGKKRTGPRPETPLLRQHFASWLHEVRGIISTLYESAERIERRLRADPDSPLANLIRHEVAMDLIRGLETAENACNSIGSSNGIVLPDPVAEVDRWEVDTLAGKRPE